MDTLDNLYKVVKDEYKILQENYQQRKENNFDLSEESKVQLDNFFERTSQCVLRNILKKYIAGIEKGKGQNTYYTVKVPVIASKRFYGKEYLIGLYLDKMEENGFEEIGLAGLSINKSRCYGKAFSEELIIDTKEQRENIIYNDETYFLEATFTPRKKKDIVVYTKE